MTDNAQHEASGGMLDSLKLLISLAAIVGGLVAYYLYPELALPLRVLMVLAGVIAGCLIALTTVKGQMFWSFVQGSRVEIRKVHWPRRQETTQATIAVFIFTLLLGLFFWGLDAILLWVTRTLTGN